MDRDGLLARLAGCADRIDALRGELDAELDRRDGLMVEAIDAGCSYRQLERAARIKGSVIHKHVTRELAEREQHGTRGRETPR